MQLVIKSRNIQLSKQFKGRLGSQVYSVFHRTQQLVQRITVTLSDINGPKGGMDKQCKVKVSLAGLPSVLVVTTQDSLQKAFAYAVERANDVMKKRVEKHQKRSKRGRVAIVLEGSEEPLLIEN